MAEKVSLNQDNPDFLSQLNKDFKKSKAEQILRLLKDQENLNDRFREFAIDTDESDARTDEETGRSTDSDDSIGETERKIADRISLRKHMGVRCKTSMGFYNDIEYDPDSGVESGVGVNSRDNTPKLRPNRASNSNPRRRMYAPAAPGTGLKLDLNDSLNSDEPVIESARNAPRPSSGTHSARRSVKAAYMDKRPAEPSLPLNQESCLRLRPRLYSAKIDPLYRQTPIKGFCDSDEMLASNQEVPYKSYGLLPSRSFTPQNVPVPTPTHDDFPPRRGSLTRTITNSDRDKLSNKYSPSIRPYTPGFQSRSDCRILTPGKTNVRRKLPDISKAKGLTLMKLPPLESSVNKSVPTENCSSYLKGPVFQSLGVDH